DAAFGYFMSGDWPQALLEPRHCLARSARQRSQSLDRFGRISVAELLPEGVQGRGCQGDWLAIAEEVGHRPEKDGRIVATGGEQFAVGRKSDRADCPLMTEEPDQSFAGGGIPKTDSAILAGAGKHLVAGAEGDAMNQSLMALQLPQFLGSRHVPEHYR